MELFGPVVYTLRRQGCLVLAPVNPNSYFFVLTYVNMSNGANFGVLDRRKFAEMIMGHLSIMDLT